MVAAVGIVEDGLHHLSRVEAIAPAAIPDREAALLAEARSLMPALPFPRIDVLVIDAMGKDISGAGMDTNIIGRGVDGRPFATRRSDVGAIWVRSLTPASHGNAIGIGLADVASKSLVDPIDPDSIFVNALSSMTPTTAKTPMYFPHRSRVPQGGGPLLGQRRRRRRHRPHQEHAGARSLRRLRDLPRRDRRPQRPAHRVRRDAADLRRRRQLRGVRAIRWPRPQRTDGPAAFARARRRVGRRPLLTSRAAKISKRSAELPNACRPLAERDRLAVRYSPDYALISRRRPSALALPA